MIQKKKKKSVFITTKKGMFRKPAKIKSKFVLRYQVPLERPCSRAREPHMRSATKAYPSKVLDPSK